MTNRRPGSETVRALLRSAPPPMARALPRFEEIEDPPASPGPLFAVWLARALADGVLDPQAAVLSTADSSGAPDARVIVLRDVDAEGRHWEFAADAESPKGRQLAANPVAALTLYWPQLGRQIRVRGDVAAATAEESAADFRHRSPAARASILPGRQSRPLVDASAQAEEQREAEAALRANPDLVAPAHTVYRIRARSVEFWQGSASRLHVRLLFRSSADTEGAEGTGTPGGGPDETHSWVRELLRP